MDAKSRANFINSVAAGQVVPCPSCGAENKPDSLHCASCGAAMTAAAGAETPAFAPVAEPVQPAAQPAASPVPRAGAYVEPESVFAKGLPDWDIVPPQVMVRRR